MLIPFGQQRKDWWHGRRLQPHLEPILGHSIGLLYFLPHMRGASQCESQLSRVPVHEPPIPSSLECMLIGAS